MRKDDQINFRVNHQVKQRWQTIAEKHGLSMVAWLTQLANREVKRD